MKSPQPSKPERIDEEQRPFDFKDIIDRAVHFQIKPRLKDDTRLIRAVNGALKDVSPRIDCFCIPWAKESRLFLVHHDPALFDDRATLETLGKQLLGIDKPVAVEVSDRSIRRVENSLVSPALYGGAVTTALVVAFCRSVSRLSTQVTVNCRVGKSYFQPHVRPVNVVPTGNGCPSSASSIGE